jgi:hypothetical protein
MHFRASPARASLAHFPEIILAKDRISTDYGVLLAAKDETTHLDISRDDMVFIYASRQP